jgi:hypothetical protein
MRTRWAIPTAVLLLGASCGGANHRASHKARSAPEAAFHAVGHYAERISDQRVAYTACLSAPRHLATMTYYQCYAELKDGSCRAFLAVVNGEHFDPTLDPKHRCP